MKLVLSLTRLSRLQMIPLRSGQKKGDHRQSCPAELRRGRDQLHKWHDQQDAKRFSHRRILRKCALLSTLLMHRPKNAEKTPQGEPRNLLCLRISIDPIPDSAIFKVVNKWDILLAVRSWRIVVKPFALLSIYTTTPGTRCVQERKLLPG
jgi:hypothetical protein